MYENNYPILSYSSSLFHFIQILFWFCLDKFWDKSRIIRHGRAFLVFIVGLQEDKVADLEEESDQNGDLVITEHLDSYNNLTLKTMAAFDWMLTFCPQTEYLLKTDDDMFIQVSFFIYIPSYSYSNRGGQIMPTYYCSVLAPPMFFTLRHHKNSKIFF